MREYGKVKRLELWWQLCRTSLPVRDLENFRPMDFCSTRVYNTFYRNSLKVNNAIWFNKDKEINFTVQVWRLSRYFSSRFGSSRLRCCVLVSVAPYVWKFKPSESNFRKIQHHISGNLRPKIILIKSLKFPSTITTPQVH